MRVDDRIEENVVWSYETPFEEGEAYAGYIAFYWNKADRWFVDDEEIDSPPESQQKGD